MGTEQRIRLPLAGLLIVFVAPLASLMVIVPSLFAGGVSPITNPAASAISRILSSLPATRRIEPGFTPRVLPAPLPSNPITAGPPGPSSPSTSAQPVAVTPQTVASPAAQPKTPTVPVAVDVDKHGKGKAKGDGDDNHEGS
ncbi:MAG TPA: hypothetical protein VF137_02760 [Candidatus Dormibacteraeota bacterium]